MSQSTDVGAEVADPNKRYHIAVPVTVHVYTDAPDSSAAREVASKVACGVQAPDGAHHVSFGPVPPPMGHWAGDDLKPRGEGRELLVAIFKLCFGHNGPHLPFEGDIERTARLTFMKLSQAEKIEANGVYIQKGVDLSPEDDELVIDRAWFGGDGWGVAYCGYTDGQRWNGWAQPLLTAAQVDHFIREQNKIADEYPEQCFRPSWVEYDGFKKLHIHYPDEPDTSYDITPRRYKTADGHLYLYDVGLGLCWDTYTAEELERDEIPVTGDHGV